MLLLFDFNLQLFSGLSDVLTRLLEPLLHVHNFCLELPAAFLAVYLQEKMIPPLQGFRLMWKPNDRIPNLIAFQLISADLIVHDRHIESISGELLEWNPDHLCQQAATLPPTARHPIASDYPSR